MDSQVNARILYEVIELVAANQEVSASLTDVSAYLLQQFAGQLAAVFLADQQRENLVLRLLVDRQGRRLPGGPLPRYPLQAQNLFTQTWISRIPAQGGNPFKQPPAGGEADLPAVLRQPECCWVFPLGDDSTSYGVLALFFPREAPLADGDSHLIAAVSRLLAIGIRNSELDDWAQKKIQRLQFLYDFNEAITSTMDRDRMLSIAIPACLQLLKTSAYVLRLADADSGRLRVERQSPELDAAEAGDPETARQAYRDRQPRLHADGRFPVYVCLPLLSQGKAIGTLEFFDPPGTIPRRQFNRQDLKLLMTIATQLGTALVRTTMYQRLAELNRENERRARRLTTINELENMLLAADDPDTLMKLILGAITSQRGFGFDRAMLFLLDRKRRRLCGRLAATKTDISFGRGDGWQGEEQTPAEYLEMIAGQLCQAAAATPDSLSRDLDNCRIPLQQPEQAIINDILERKKAVLIRVADPEAPRIPPPLSHLLTDQETIFLPLASKEETFGLLVVDNGISLAPIRQTEIPYLKMFVGAAALALDRALLNIQFDQALSMLHETQQKLEQSEKLAALGEMAAGIAHEIKNPLVSIGGFARRLYRQLPADSREKAYGQIIISEINRLEKIVKDVLTFSRGQAEPLEECDLNALVEEIADFFRKDLKQENIRLELQLAPELPPVECNRNQIKQVLINLIANSKQAIGSRPGGRIIVRSAREAGDQPRVRLEIEDNGGGINPELLHNIFNPFFTTKDDGTGLGLPISHKIVLNHQGSIKVKNKEAEGATFIIKLPVRQQKLQHITGSASEP
ncbi:MAG: GAF domain-containing protein [Deltaproteobacteria bacterium]|nr:GAF domain-containing protein [Deltaproteobacteria bacterium]